jgi:hypothetical protein
MCVLHLARYDGDVEVVVPTARAVVVVVVIARVEAVAPAIVVVEVMIFVDVLVVVLVDDVCCTLMGNPREVVAFVAVVVAAVVCEPFLNVSEAATRDCPLTFLA